MIQNIWKDIKTTKNNYFEFKKKDNEKETIIKELKAHSFSSDVYSFVKIPRLVQKWFWTWALFAIYSSATFIVMIPFAIARVVISFILDMFGYTSKYSSWSYIMVVFNLLIFTSEFKIFDVSYLYHTFRAQSALKFYGLLFAFEISEKLLTLIGKKVFTALNTQMEQSDNNIMKCWKEIVCSFCYIVVHTMSIYLEYIVFIVILNSQINSFIIYFFVMNLTKMKSTAFKKVDEKAYAAQINYDAKDRMNKLLYIILFVCSQSIRRVDLYAVKLFLFINIGTLIEWVKHLTILNLAQKQLDIEGMRSKVIAEVGNDKKPSLMKCLSIDYTLLPMMTFVLKMIMTITDPKNTSTDLLGLFTDIMILLGYLVVLPILYLLYRTFKAILSA